jgi:heme a synthase
MLKSSRRFARFAWIVLAFNVAVSMWGAFVRTSGSGAGCGNHWPLCGATLSPVFATLATVIEFLHRATSGIDVVLVAALIVWAFRAFPKGHAARLGAALSGVFLLTEALLGAALVLLGAVGNNPDPSHGYLLAVHLMNTLTLLGCLTVTGWWGAGHARVRLRPAAMWTLAAVMLLGVTGAIAALADTIFPATSLAAGLAQDFEPGANLFLKLRGLHPVLAAGVGTWLFLFAAARAGTTRRPATAVMGLVVVQVLAGVLNLLLLAPMGLQMVHLLLNYGVWIALVLLCVA